MALVLLLTIVLMVGALATAALLWARRARESGRDFGAILQADALTPMASGFATQQLRDAIEQFSTRYDSDGRTLYLPRAASNWIAPRTVRGSYPNLLQTSRSDRSASRFLSFASPVDSTARSRDGRIVSFARWNQPGLLPVDAQDFDPTDVPQWILVGREGPVRFDQMAPSLSNRASLQNPAAIVGRFAYAVYDVGGLVDANAAGYPPTVLEASMAAGKSHAGFLDLTQIPGIEDANQFVQWRNAATARTASEYLSYLTEIAVPRGFRRPAQGDRAFLSRADLIAGAESGQIGLSPECLPYLTTFNRDLDAPSSLPPINAPSFAYRQLALAPTPQASTAVNRWLAAVSDPAGEGMPLLKRRFSLQRFAWLEQKAANPANTQLDEKIRQFFGLVWNEVGRAWEYRSPEGGAIAGRIRRLDEIQRESGPDFFELLQACIPAGSLVQAESGVTALTAGDANGNGVADTQETADHVMQLGANLIDQWDADSVPTRIYFNGRTDANAGASLAVTGVESLPYLSSVSVQVYRPMGVAFDVNGFSRAILRGWLEFSLWNPHQNLGENVVGTLAPQRLRILLSRGRVALRALSDRYPSGEMINDGMGPPWFYGAFDGSERGGTDAPVTTQPMAEAGRFIEFTNNGSLFEEIHTLRATDLTGTSQLQDRLVEDGVSIAGICLGDLYVPTRILNPAGQYYYDEPDAVAPTLPFAGPNTPLNFERAECWIEIPPIIDLQCEWPVGSGRFWTYQRLENLLAAAPGPLQERSRRQSVENMDGDQFSTPGQRIFAAGLIDPRTTRFGAQLMRPQFEIANEHQPGSSAYRNFEDAGFYNESDRPFAGALLPVRLGTSSFFPNIPAAWNLAPFSHFYLQDNSRENPPLVGTAPGAWYADPDGQLRAGDGRFDRGVIPTVRGHTTFRPRVLNRPFENVGEMLYAFRDVPWRSLDADADGALLDAFTVASSLEEETQVQNTEALVAGRINLNTPHPEVLMAVLAGARQRERDGSRFSKAQARALADHLIAKTRTTPFTSRSDLGKAFSNYATLNGIEATKESREAAVRALSEVGSTRVWNVLFDVIVHAGYYPSDAERLEDFFVQSERRAWIWCAIDRLTGKVLERQVEPVVGSD